MRLESLDGLGACMATADKKVMISGRDLKSKGMVSVSEVLTAENIPYTTVANGYQVQTKSGKTMQVPSIIAYKDKQALIDSINEIQTVTPNGSDAATPECTCHKEQLKNAGKWALGLLAAIVAIKLLSPKKVKPLNGLKAEREDKSTTVMLPAVQL